MKNFFIVAGHIKLKQKLSLWPKWCQAVRIVKEVKILRERQTVLRNTRTAYLVETY